MNYLVNVYAYTFCNARDRQCAVDVAECVSIQTEALFKKKLFGAILFEIDFFDERENEILVNMKIIYFFTLFSAV